ncbi:WG repeat-containing protein [Paenibacillus kobensis]|uniref:WG repeat-containing protein n=1 Tax=Paenibacillus kobensis TaxID=59841 RepID=UPI000FD7C44D|nr:WG repeat-containing protein [Paenibacillus kobensis]
MMRKRIWSMLLAIALVCSAVPAAYASESLAYGIEPQYESAGVFFEGLAAVQKGGKWGYIDKTGAVVVPFQYDAAQQLSGGLAVVGLLTDGEMKFGYINGQGKEVTPIVYDSTGYGNNGYAHVIMKGKKSGSVYDSDAAYGLVGLQGEIIPPVYESVSDVSDGMIVVKQDGKFGYFDTSGKAVTPFIYTDANPFSNGLGRVYQKAKSGFVDRTGKAVIPLDSRSYGDFHEGLAAVLVDGKYGYIDTFGQMIVKPKYEEAWYFNNGLAPVKLNGKYGYIDQTGKTVVPFRYDEISNTFTNGLARVSIGEDYFLKPSEDQYYSGQGSRLLTTKKFGYVNMQGEEVIPLQYDFAEEFRDGFAKVGKGGSGAGSYYEGGKLGYVDSTGKEVVAPVYDFVGGDIEEGYIGIREGMSPVSNGGSGKFDEYTGGKWGYVNGAGQEIVPLIYDKTYPFRAGLGMVRKDGKIGFVDKTGQLVIPTIYDDASVFMNGYAQVQQGSLAGFVSAVGGAADLRFKAIRPFREGIATVEDGNGRMGFLRNPLPALAPVNIDIAQRSDGGPATVTLSSSDPDAVILYTIDGSEPHTYIAAWGTNEYSKPFKLYESATVKAVAIARGKQDSILAAAQYTHTFQPLKPAANSDEGTSASSGNKPSGNTTANKSGFVDVADTHWASNSIKWAVSQGIASGYEGGKFRPDAVVTEPEFLAMLLRAFPDIQVPEKAAGAAWSAPYYAVAKTYNWPVLNSTSGKGFNRGQVAMLLSASQGFAFRDTKGAIQYVLDLNIAGGKTSRTVEGFGSSDQLKRSEAITLIHNLKERGFQLTKATIVPDTMPKEFQVGGISIGDTEASVLARLGQPARKDISELGFTWYIYNADYTKYMQVGVQNGKVVGLFSNADTWKSNRGLKLGASTAEIEKRYGTGGASFTKGKIVYTVNASYQFLQDGSYVTVYLDKHDGNKATAIQLIDQAVEEKMATYFGKGTSELRESFERQSLDLVNAFRVRYGLSALRWDGTAAGTARAHSEDMRDRGFFDHVNPDGKDPGNRMDAAGIPYGLTGENIAAGQRDAIEAYQSWVNSKGHRDNMLYDGWTHLGVGVAFNAAYQGNPWESDFGMYYTQNFYGDSSASAQASQNYENGQQRQSQIDSLRSTYKNDGGAFELYIIKSNPQPDGSTVNDYGLRNSASITLPPHSAIYVAAGSNYIKFEDDYYNYNFGGKLVLANHTDKPTTVPAGKIQFAMESLYRDNGGIVTTPDGKSMTLKSTGPYVRMVAFDGDFDETKEYKSYIDDNKVFVSWAWSEVTKRAQ